MMGMNEPKKTSNDSGTDSGTRRTLNPMATNSALEAATMTMPRV